MSERIATCRPQQELPAGAVPDLVHLLPASVISARDGRRFRLTDPEAVIKASRRGTDLPIDYEHQNDDPARRAGNGAVPAAGWITDLFTKANGSIWGRVVWTARAREHIAAREYRYLSPVFTYDESGMVLRIKGAGLVHDPALELTALAREETSSMPDFSRIAAALDLDEDADEDAILSAIETLKSVAAGADANEPRRALARRQDAPDPAKFVPIEAVRDLMRDRNHKLALLSESEAEAKVARGGGRPDHAGDARMGNGALPAGPGELRCLPALHAAGLRLPVRAPGCPVSGHAAGRARRPDRGRGDRHLRPARPHARAAEGLRRVAGLPFSLTVQGISGVTDRLSGLVDADLDKFAYTVGHHA